MRKRDFDKDKMKLAAFDIDGTIFDRGTMLPETRDAIFRLRGSGVETVLSTGRHPFNLPELISGMDCFRYAIACNGGVVADIRNREIFFETAFSRQEARDIAFRIADLTDLVHIVYSDSGLITRTDLERVEAKYHAANDRKKASAKLRGLYRVCSDARALADSIDEPVIKLGCRFDSYDETVEGCGAISAVVDAEVVVTDDDMVEINPRGINKAAGLEKLCSRLGLLPENAVAFGDSGNDAALMKRAGYCVAMGNASADVKAIADYVTDAIRNDGVGRAIKHLFNV